MQDLYYNTFLYVFFLCNSKNNSSFPLFFLKKGHHAFRCKKKKKWIISSFLHISKVKLIMIKHNN